jgi:hypothetical protein
MESGGGSADAKTSSTGQDLVVKVLGAVGTGIGALGFVTLFGGAILWVRANQAGLPANEAVAVIPKNVLVTTGASFLVPAVLLAMLVVLTIAAIHLGFSLPSRLKARTERKVAAEARYAADNAARTAPPKERLAASASELANELSTSLTKVQDAPGATAQLAPMQELAAKQHEEALTHQKAARAARATADVLEMEAQEREAELKLSLTNKPGVDKAELWVERAAAFGVLTVLPLALYWSTLEEAGFWRGAILIAIAVTTAVLSVAVYVATEKLVWFGVVAFFAVGVYTGCARYFQSVHTPKVEPVAALRGERPPIVGYFVANTSEDLYVGTFRSPREPARLVVVPKSQVTAMDVGPLLVPATARERAFAAAVMECQEQIQQTDAQKHVTPAASCTPAQEAALKQAEGER